MSNYKKISQLLTIILFMALLIVPSTIMFFNPKEKKQNKNEEELSEIDRVNELFQKEFGLKTELIDSYFKFKNNINVSPLPNSCVVGKSGWYFLGNEYNNLFDDSFGYNTVIDSQELETIKNNIESMRSFLTSKGIDFKIVVPPNKHRVYPEYLPYSHPQKKTRLEILNDYLKKEIDFEIVYLRDTLVKAKSEKLLYYKTNTHWNDYGAYIGYNYTMKIINKTHDLPIAGIEEYEEVIQPIKVNDVTQQINLTFKEDAIFLQKKDTIATKIIFSKYHKQVFSNPSKTKTLLMHRDSFANAWMGFFNESFGTTIYLRGYKLNKELINKEKPDIVIFEMIERNLFENLSK
ncbi:hypothetical protein DMZ43_03640 [Meridianimaribacter sp. CL38]|uniref:alginate O-acetyltransferase AlgX-related protein n=1 Tax=Meridianimaribacter sp. CL38 TaxID=2213021 RepID=UPI00103BB987|nr:hypothetical protein [Meridianimaribacter sp. CL38]TBV28146.1 hypothetical protein DMZ43_03640 [Meridianimaribacter sp. CL38]